MKKALLLIIASCLIGFTAAQAQVIADFEAAAAGTQGFVDNGWGKGLTGVNRIADPTGRSAGVLAVGFNGANDTRGDFEKPSFSPKKAHVISILVYLPSNFPDDGALQIFGQDNKNWSHTTETYLGKNLPKQAWIPLNFHIAGLNLADPSKFNPYDPNQFGRWGIEVQGGANAASFAGELFFDDVTLLGDEPKVQADFETSLNEWANSGWSPGISAVELIADPNDAANHVMSVGLDFALGNTGQLTSGQINLAKDDHVMAFQIWVPASFPDSNVIRIVGQDRKNWADGAVQVYYGVDLVKEQWNEIYLDILRFYQTDSSKFVPYSSGGFGRVWIGFENNTTFTGSIYMDNIILCKPAPPPTAKLESPPIIASAGLTDYTDPFTGEVFYYNKIEWTDLSADIGETYSVYFSETGKITDVTTPGVIQISQQIGRNTQVWNHRIYTIDGAEKTVYYAVTVTGIEGGQVIETPVRDGISNSGAITAKTSLLYEVPFVESFNFAADAYLDEFEALATTFTRGTFRNQNATGDEAASWTTESTDLNFNGYLVMDNENLYVGMDVVDDYPYGDGQCWGGDGFDVFSGLYDVRTLTSYFRGTDCQRGGTVGGGFRIGSAIGASQGDHIQIGGYEAWTPDGVAYAQDIFEGGYIVEFMIPIATMNAQFNANFTPEDGMILPLKFDINDNDSSAAGNFRSMQNHWGDTPGNFQGWQRAESWGAPVILTKTPIVGVASRNIPSPYRYDLSRNYPNPFNPSTTLKYLLPHTADVKIVVYDLLGKEIRTLINERKAAGSYTAKWDGANDAGHQVSSGIYFCKMITSDFTRIQKMTLLK